MKEEFNQLVIKLLTDFISQHKLLGSKKSFTEKNKLQKYNFDKNSFGSNLEDMQKYINSLDMFAPMAYYARFSDKKIYLIDFNILNKELFKVFLDTFLNTKYEDLFISTINKIIPINFCIENQPWSVVKKFLINPVFKGNGLPDVEMTQLFFINLKKYTQQKDFNDSFFIFCKINTSLLKRIESQTYLKDFLFNISDKEKFSIFLKEDSHPFMTVNNDFLTYRLYKPTLFSKFSHLVKNKKQPVSQLLNLLNMLSYHIPEKTEINQLFFVQVEEKYKELIIFVNFSKTINYSFEEYIMFLLENYLERKINSQQDLIRVSNFYFLNNKLAPKSIKQKTTKI